MAALKAEIDELKAENSELKAERRELLKEKSTIENSSDLTARKGQIDLITQQIMSKESLMASHGQRIAALETAANNYQRGKNIPHYCWR